MSTVAQTKPADATDDKIKKRLYIRKMMRIYRNEAKIEFTYLKSRAAALEVELKALEKEKARKSESPPPSADEQDPTTLLRWKDVAYALREDNSQSFLDNRMHKNELRMMREVINDMQRWVSAYMSFKVYILYSKTPFLKARVGPSEPQRVDVAQRDVVGESRVSEARQAMDHGAHVPQCGRILSAIALSRETRTVLFNGYGVSR